MDPGSSRARGASIRLIPPDDEDPFVEPEKLQRPYAASSNAVRPDRSGLVASRAGQESFHFGFASPAAASPPSPVVGESALSPPEPSKSRFSQSTIVSPEHARISSFAVPWHPPPDASEPRFSTDSASDAPGLLPPQEPNQSRFSRNTSSQSDSPPSQSLFAPTIDDGSSPETPRFSVPSRSHFSATTVDSPPPLPPRADRPFSPLESPPTPSQWQAFFSPQQEQYRSRFSASTTTPPEQSPPSPPSSAGSGSSNSSMDGTGPSALPSMPPQPLYTQPNRRLNSSSSSRYSHPYPTTELEVIDEDEVYNSSPPFYPPPIPWRSSSRPRTADRETQTSDSLEAGYPAGAAAAVAFAAGSLSPPTLATTTLSRRNDLPPIPPLPPALLAPGSGARPISTPPQLPPLPPFNHSTSSLQHYFSYFPAPDPAATPVIGADGQPRSPNGSVVSFGSVTGPNGERFSALREQRKSRGVYWAEGTKRRQWCGLRGMTWKLWAALLTVVVLALVLLAVGLGVGLSRNRGTGDGDGNNAADDGDAAGNGNGVAGEGGGDVQPVFPAGTFDITTNLMNVSTACSNVSAAWNCAPGPTLVQGGVNASQIEMVWTITQNNVTQGAESDDGFSISSGGNPFSIRFDDAALTLREQGTENEHWGFEALVSKRVKPDVDITGRNGAVECDYDQVELAGRLFTRRQADEALADGEGSWPGAVEVDQRSSAEGACFEVSNGVRGPQVAVSAGSADCTCAYGDSGLGS